MLAAFQKAYKRDAFHENNLCPISLEVIECYMQILLPAFNFNLIMQKNSPHRDVQGVADLPGRHLRVVQIHHTLKF